MSYTIQDLLALRKACYAVLEAFDGALAVCCPRCEHEPEGAIWADTHSYPGRGTLDEAISALRALLGDKEAPVK